MRLNASQRRCLADIKKEISHETIQAHREEFLNGREYRPRSSPVIARTSMGYTDGVSWAVWHWVPAESVLYVGDHPPPAAETRLAELMRLKETLVWGGP
jgi:hypothetical protein